MRKTTVFFIVNALASVGLNIGVVGVNWFIIDATRQNNILGLYGAVSILSALVTLALSGQLTDKYNKMSLLSVCCVGQAVLFFAVALLHGVAVPAGWIIALLAVLNMPLMVLFSIVSRGAVAALWPKETFSRGNAVIEVTLQMGAMCAALLTGILYGRFGFSCLIALGGALTLAAGLLVLFSPVRFDYTLSAKESYWDGLRAGLAYLRKNPSVGVYGLAAFVPTLLISVSNTVIPGYVEQTLQADAFVYGAGDMLFAVGALLAGWWGSCRTGKVRGGGIGAGFTAVIAGLVLLGFWPRVWLFYAGVFGVGVFLARLRIALNTCFMQITQADYLGRSLSLLMALVMGVQALLAYVAGVSMDKWGAASGFILLALIGLCGPVLLCFAPRKTR